MNLYPLIQLLSDGEYHSGTHLGKALGVSRTAVWKQIQQLSSWGLLCHADKQQGYRLDTPLQLLDEKWLRSSLTTQGVLKAPKLEVLPKIDSTNTYLLNRVQAGQSVHQHLITAEMQDQGRGRRGRAWFSPFAHSISCSLGWELEAPARELQGLSLAVGVALAEVISAQGFVGLGLKWPNDIYLDGYKLGGILIEITGDLAGPCTLVVGYGINIFKPSIFDPAALDQPIAFLDQQGLVPQRCQLVADTFRAVAQVLEAYTVSGFQPWMQRWNDLHLWKGREANVVRGESKQPVTLGDVNEIGELRVTDDAGHEYPLNSGEISLRLRQ